MYAVRSELYRTFSNIGRLMHLSDTHVFDRHTRVRTKANATFSISTSNGSSVHVELANSSTDCATRWEKSVRMSAIDHWLRALTTPPADTTELKIHQYLRQTATTKVSSHHQRGPTWRPLTCSYYQGWWNRKRFRDTRTMIKEKSLDALNSALHYENVWNNGKSVISYSVLRKGLMFSKRDVS